MLYSSPPRQCRRQIGKGSLSGAKQKIFFELLENTKNRPSGVSDEELVRQGNAICAANDNGGVGGAIGSTFDVTRETKKKLNISFKCEWRSPPVSDRHAL